MTRVSWWSIFWVAEVAEAGLGEVDGDEHHPGVAVADAAGMAGAEVVGVDGLVFGVGSVLFKDWAEGWILGGADAVAEDAALLGGVEHVLEDFLEVFALNGTGGGGELAR